MNEKIIVKATITKDLPGRSFEAELENGYKITAHLSGKLYKAKIKVLPGDQVDVELSPYNTQMGRIVWRYRQ